MPSTPYVNTDRSKAGGWPLSVLPDAIHGAVMAMIPCPDKMRLTTDKIANFAFQYVHPLYPSNRNRYPGMFSGPIGQWRNHGLHRCRSTECSRFPAYIAGA